jgi:hypothetical protein
LFLVQCHAAYVVFYGMNIIPLNKITWRNRQTYLTSLEKDDLRNMALRWLQWITWALFVNRSFLDSEGCGFYSRHFGSRFLHFVCNRCLLGRHKLSSDNLSSPSAGIIRGDTMHVLYSVSCSNFLLERTLIIICNNCRWT